MVLQLSEEFYVRTSDQLLIQPEPQYLYAQILLGAFGISLTPPDQLGLAGREVSGVGANYTAADADRLRLSNPMFSDVIATKIDFNGQPGSTVNINRPVFANTTYTEASRRIQVGSTISTTPVAMTGQQTQLTLFNYGGPYDATQAAVAPYAINAFDANMGVHNQVRIFGTQIVRDFHKFLDAVEVSLLDLAANVDYPDGMSADNDPTQTGSFPFTYEQLSRVETNMDNSNLPTFPDGFRALVLTPTQVNQLRADDQYQRAAQFFPQYNILFPQYVASVNKFHVFKSTTLSVKANSSSININYGHAIAPGALLGGMGRRPEVIPNTNDNYRQTILAIWNGDLAFGLANNTLVRSVRSSA